MPCQETSPGNSSCGTVAESRTVYMSNLFNPNNTDLQAFFNILFTVAISIGAILAVLRLAYAGVVYMTTDLVTSKQNARQMIADVVLGLIVLLAIWVILFQINPDLLNLDILRSVRTS